MDVSIIMLLAAILIYTLWWNHKKIQSNIFRCKFFELRSKLRDIVILGEVEPDSKLFIYLDKTMTSIINDMSTVNLYKNIIMSYILRKRVRNVDLEKFNEILKNDPILEKVFNEFVGLLTQYSIRKHFVTLILLAIISMPIFKSMEFLRKYSQVINYKMKLNYRQYEETLVVIG